VSVSKAVAKAIARDAVQMEAKNQKILTSNLLAAREKLLENPDKWQHHTFGDLLNETMAEYEATAIEEFPIEDTLKHGQKEGQLFAGMDMGAPKGANFWQWTPVLPSHAIAMAESEFANTIGKATTDFKTTALRTVQQGLAMGSRTQDMMDDLLGVGLSGAKGKDGKFRQAVNRAEAIARTVSNDLINRGAMITYGQIDRISPELGLQKIWQTLSDNRTSDRCLSLSGQKRELTEEFQAGDGWTGQNPPAHPYCRSRVTSRAANKNYSKDINERFAKMPAAPIVEPEPAPELLEEPLSDPLPTPKKATTPLEKTLKKEESLIRNNATESAVIVDAFGKVLFRKEGGDTSVSFSVEELTQMEKQILTHNHPLISDFVGADLDKITGRSFSPADITMAAYVRLTEIRAVTPVSEFSLKLKKPEKLSGKYATRLNTAKRQYKKAEQEVSAKLGQAMLDKKITYSEIESVKYHLTAKKFADNSKKVFEYEVTGDESALKKLTEIENKIGF
jgi:hypothetical protein